MEILSKEEAKKLNLKTYFTGILCKNGHLSERQTSNGTCIICRRLTGIKYKDRYKKYEQTEKGKLARKKALTKYNSNPKAKIVRKKWIDKNKDYIYEKQRNRKFIDPIGILLISAKRRAKVKGLKFNITREDLEIPKICPILKIPIYISNKKHCDNSPSIDRIDSYDGYIKGNVQIISHRANMLKNNGNIEEFKNIVEFLENLQKKNNEKEVII